MGSNIDKELPWSHSTQRRCMEIAWRLCSDCATDVLQGLSQECFRLPHQHDSLFGGADINLHLGIHSHHTWNSIFLCCWCATLDPTLEEWLMKSLSTGISSTTNKSQRCGIRYLYDTNIQKQDCSICLQDLTMSLGVNDKKEDVETKCGHIFHE